MKQVDWDVVRERLVNDDEATRLLLAMDEAGGEPALVQNEGALCFFDTAPEASKIPHRKSLCYDEAARLNRKKNPLTGDVVTAAEKLGAHLLDEEDYLFLQSVGDFDLKCSCWRPQAWRGGLWRQALWPRLHLPQHRRLLLR
ncbi:MAG: DUF4256 domain-containing protein [Limosilactobacillus fermentum]|nr:DUF4256 domain-containing protein [Limosilactobacillus fermentum]MBS6067770.1 DUF4256 domain-containing protein [Limosilactobacillus fermentum]WCE97217.1 DUF4256 domain-containing protein [Limosilactobacillus fermentum]